MIELLAVSTASWKEYSAATDPEAFSRPTVAPAPCCTGVDIAP